jgi:citrate lyase beta subunit
MTPAVSAEALLAEVQALLADDDARRDRLYPSADTGHQPVHTVYLPADRFDAGSIAHWRSQAVACLDEHGPVPGYDDLDQQIRAKLEREPIEDLRIDFEDGYGVRGDDEEDRCAGAAATALTALAEQGALPRCSGIRIKSLEPAVRGRAIRTLTIFLETILTAGPMPDGFRCTLPKVTSVVQVEAMVRICESLEARLQLNPGQLRFEIQVETPQSIISAAGAVTIAPMLHAALGRCAGLHYGTYDYSAAVGVAAQFQSMEHPAADFAKAVLQVAAAGTGVPVSDGSTNILPVGDGDTVRSAWALHARLVRRSLERGFYQGWDLHPAQLPTRYAATFRFYADGTPVAVARLRAYLERVESGVLDEPATAKALAGFIIRALESGAVSPAGGLLADPGTLRRLATHGV